MDNVTHALAGLLLADAAVQVVERAGTSVPTRFRTAVSVLGIVAAEFPDSDLIYSGSVLKMGKLGYLLHHRGHTHTIVWALVSAVMLWFVARWWVARRLPAESRAWFRDTGARALLAVAVVGTLSHLLLDWTNSYGVHPFWPFNGTWYYGDAVFIVEPWLWVVAIPALFWTRPARGSQVVLAVLLLAILAASALLGQVARDVSAVIITAALLWMFTARWLTPRTRVVAGAGSWAVVTLMFMLMSSRAEAAVRMAVRDAAAHPANASELVQDVVLNPAPGDPFCWSALVITGNASTYRLSAGRTSAVGALRDCRTAYAAAYRTDNTALAALTNASAQVPFDSSGVEWQRTWATARGELAALASRHCEVAAALYFMRAPAWQRGADGVLQFSDVRYGVGGEGFAALTLQPSTPCTVPRAWIPGWVPPRAALLP